ncbi:MAG: DUF4082 domain-containing protein [Ferruginibacter sp.]
MNCIFTSTRLGKFISLIFLVLISVSHSFGQNAIVNENLLPGTPQNIWDPVSDNTPIEGFAQEFSVNVGETVHFKIEVESATLLPYTVKIYRIGWYQGNGARFITNIGTNLMGNMQPAGNYETATGKFDCNTWPVATQWDVPVTAVSGVYVARLDCPALSASSLVIFVVRNDNANSSALFKTSDATWQAYNQYGGNSFYIAGTPVPGHSQATKISYQRPLRLRGDKSNFFNAEYPMIRWLEKNGYDVSYATDMDMARDFTPFTPAIHKTLFSVGHDEYWSTEEFNKFETARNNGVHLGFFSGNEVYWKTRWEDSYQTLVCYKEGTLGESVCNVKCDPMAGVWTGLWRDGCTPAYAPNDGCRPEGSLTGQMSWTQSTGSIKVPDTYKNYRFWKNTSIATLTAGQEVTLPYGTLGNEWDPEQYVSTYPTHRIVLSNTTQTSKIHKMALYRHSSGALVFGAGTMQWSWGLDNRHDLNTATPPAQAASLDMKQATMNLLSDMGLIPDSPEPGLIVPTGLLDVLAPNSTITYPTHGSSVSGGSITVTGTSADNGGGVIAGVEVSVDNGATWQTATGFENWSYTFTPVGFGSITIKARAWDDVGNVEAAGTAPSANAISILVTGPFNYSVFNSTYPQTQPLFFSGAPVELGMKFRSSIPGSVTGFRYYKGAGITGIHVGHLWNNTGTLLATDTFVNETASGWQSVQLATPVAIAPNTTYIVSYFTSSGEFIREEPFFTSAVVNGFLRGLANGEDGGNGVYEYDANPIFPDNTSGSSNYYADVIFTSSDNTPPQVVSVSPVDNATGVALNVQPSATFNEDIDPASISTSTVIMTGPGNVVVPGTVNVTGAVVTYTPNSPLAIGTPYTITLKGGINQPLITDISGNALAADYTWTFTTGGLSVPTVTADPAPQSTCANSSISFSSAAVGIPTPTVQWQVSIDNGVIWSDVPGQTASTYTFTATATDNNNQYRAIWTNSQGSDTSAAALLTVQASITGTIQAVTPNICPGSPMELTLSSASGPSPYTLVINSNTYTGIEVGQPFLTVLGDESIWTAADIPGELIHVDAGPIEVGVKFQANKDGIVKGIRFYKGGASNGGTHVGSLWSSTGTLLAQATFTNETVSGWQEVLFSTPVAVTLGTTYVASYFLPQGNYSKDGGYFTTSAHTNGNSLTALQNTVAEPNGVFTYVGTSTFPDQNFGETNYWVDVVFAAYTTATTTFDLTSITADNGCVHTGTPISSATITVSSNVNGGTVSGTSPLCIGATATYTTDGDTGGAWSSTNTGVATVDPLTGLVTAVGAGTSDISYIVAGCNGPGVGTLTLTVSPNANAGSISGTSPLCILATDTYTTDGDVGGAWASSDPLIATIDPVTGLVTALLPGTVNITYTVSTGCNNPVTSTKPLTVNILPNAGTVSGNSPLCIGTTDTYTSNGDAGGAWSSTNTAVATVDAATGLVTAIAVGTSDITYTVNGCLASSNNFKTVTVNALGTTLAGTTGGPQVCNNSNIQAGGTTFSDGSCNIIAKVTPSGLAPISGMVNTCVVIDATVQVFQGNPYVQRHYDISPATNPASSTATITLYYTQQEFDNYNVDRGIQPALPTGPTDVLGISKVLITQYHGEGTAPGNYSGNAELIDPADANIVWNSTASVWEVTFDVNGFSGFYLFTSITNTPLPIGLLSFSGRNNGNINLLAWSTSSEQNSSYFELQRSTDGINFVSTHQVTAAGNSSIQRNYSQPDDISGIRSQIFYYRLKLVDLSGIVKYSTIIKLRVDGKGLNIETSPNPFAEYLRIQIEATHAESATLILTDMHGRKIAQKTVALQEGSNAVLLDKFNNVPSAVYFLNVTTDSFHETIKVIKQ